MSNAIPEDLFVLEMANNHMGDIEHGIEVIRQFGEVCREFAEFNFAFKLQYRDLDTFIHPAMRSRDDVKYIKRFLETSLTRNDFDRLITEIRANGFLTMSTPFDESSVGMIEDQELDILKIASCSFGDWPLLERVAETALPVIVSTAGATVETIDHVTSFLTHREKDFVLMHCVAEYPTADEKIDLSQIDFLKSRYPNVKIGFSTHENPGNSDLVKLAIAKGAQAFEKHVGVPTDRYSLNEYSASPEQVKAWLFAARHAKAVCGFGDKRRAPSAAEAASLRSLRRGIFAKRDIKVGEVVCQEDVYFAFPPSEKQFTANDWSKYSSFEATMSISSDAAITSENCLRIDMRKKVRDAVEKVKTLLEESRITAPGGIQLELSHHYGMDRFNEFGLTMMTVVNREYCKKLLVSLPNQVHPEQYHLQKEETFHVLYGSVNITLDGVTHSYGPGSVINVMPGVRHGFVSPTGCVIEEISSTHFVNDSFYTDETIMQNQERKTFLTYWM